MTARGGRDVVHMSPVFSRILSIFFFSACALFFFFSSSSCFSFGKFLAKEECAWAIMGRDRTVDLESPSEADRDKWIHALEMLVAYRKEIKKQASQFEL